MYAGDIDSHKEKTMSSGAAPQIIYSQLVEGNLRFGAKVIAGGVLIYEGFMVDF